MSLDSVRKEFRYKATDQFWQSIKMIQLAPYSRIGVGHPLLFLFTIGDGDFTNEISYEYQKYGPTGSQTEKQLMREKPYQFCNFVCQKICYYIKLVHNVEVIRMNCEFLVDEFEEIFLHNATEIWVRSLNKVPQNDGKNFCKFLVEE